MRPLLLVTLGGCMSENQSLAPRADTGWDNEDADGAFDTGDAETEPPPEEEDDFLQLAPAATDAYVFIANPARDTVTRVSVPSLEALTAEVGSVPAVVATAADYTHAITLNEGSDDVSLIDADTMAVTNVAVRPNLNRLELSPDGAWALAWYDPDVEGEVAPEGVVSFNEVSLVEVATAVHTPMAVGFNPHTVEWSEDGTLAVVVSDASLAILDLSAETVSPRLVELDPDPIAAPPAEEIVLSPDNQYAYVRQFGASELMVVELTTGTLDQVEVGENPTDMDLSPDGVRLSVVSRTAQQIWSFDPADPWQTPEIVTLESAYGSVLFTSETTAIVYTNATRLPTYGVWDLATGTVVERSLVKPIKSIGVSETGTSLLVFHTLDNAADADTTSPFYDEWALTLIDLDDFRSNPLVLDAEPAGWATSDDGKWGFFILEGLDYLEILNFESLLYDEVALPEPIHLGVLPGSTTVWVNQEHSLGRISFYEPNAGSLDTITGFELNSGVEH